MESHPMTLQCQHDVKSKSTDVNFAMNSDIAAFQKDNIEEWERKKVQVLL